MAEVAINSKTFCAIMKYSAMIDARLQDHLRRERLKSEHTLKEWKKIYKQCMERVR